MKLEMYKKCNVCGSDLIQTELYSTDDIQLYFCQNMQNIFSNIQYMD